ncbi:MAG: KilA-N domain-containing protein [Clostridiales bacterium]|nr:KilA-N domain-containing protein [Clostridiales bacterium]
MAKEKNSIITVQNTIVNVTKIRKDDYISLTDIAKYRDADNPNQIISLWLRTYNTISFIGLWETINNPEFKPHIYEGFKQEAAQPTFWMSPKKWIDGTDAIGMISKSGRYGGGTLAHNEIAFEFASWISPEFKLYLISEFKRLKSEEQLQLSQEWDLQRTISKINYRIHTDAIKEHIIPPMVTKAQANIIYASEADILNVALFGLTAAEWRMNNPEKPGNIRDGATLEQLVVLSNMESINALLIKQGLSQGERLVELNQVAITQLTSLFGNKQIQRLGNSTKGKRK